MKKALSIVLFLVAGAFLTGRAEATPESRAAANFLLFEPSARASGMGNAYAAIADDANATYYNPAALAYFLVAAISRLMDRGLWALRVDRALADEAARNKR